MTLFILNLMGNSIEKRYDLLHLFIHDLLLCFLTDSFICATPPPHSGECFSFSTVCDKYTHQNNLEQISLKHNQLIIAYFSMGYCLFTTDYFDMFQKCMLKG